MRRVVPFLVLLTIVASLAASVSGGSSTASAQTVAPQRSAASNTIKIAAIHPLTGALAVDGLQMDRAARLAVQRINGAGGIRSLGGARLVIVSGDSQGKPDVGQTVAQRLIDSGALAIVGTFQSAVAANIGSLSERTKIPFVIDIAVDDALINANSRYTFRVGPNASAFGRISARYLTAMPKRAGTSIKKIAYMHERTSFGVGVFAGFKAEATKLGLSIVEEVTYDAFNTKSFTTELTRISTSGADVLATTGYFPDGLQIARDANSVRPNVKTYYGVSHGAYSQEAFVTAAGPASALVFSTDYYWNGKNPRVPKVLRSYRETFNESMRTSAMMAYQSIEVIADALERAGKANRGLLKRSTSNARQSLRNALSKTSIASPLMAFEGPIAFDATGENSKSTPVVLQVQNGRAIPVWPKVFARATPVIPGVPWKLP